MKKILGILILAIGTALLFQNCQKSDFIVVTGIVTDSATNEPIEGAMISLQNGKLVTSGKDGNFTIANAKPGRALFYVWSLSGYNSQSKTVNITEGRVTKIIFLLKKPGSPEIENLAINNISLNSATAKGYVKVGDGMSVYGYGHCWSGIITEPTIGNSPSSSFNGSNNNIAFESNITGLSVDTRYFVRAYVITSNGVFYSNVIAFTTSVNLPQLIAYYPFNDDYLDESGNGANLNGWFPFLTNDRFGNSNSAISCSSPYFTYSNSILYNTFNQFSISFWFYKSSWSGSDNSMVSTGYPNYTNWGRIGEDASPSKLYFDIKTSSGNAYKVSASSAPSLNNWHHVVAQRNNTSIQLYLDGSLQGSVNCDNQPINNNISGWGAYLFVGFDLRSSWSYFTGSMDDIRVYNRALTDSEIQYLKTH